MILIDQFSPVRYARLANKAHNVCSALARSKDSFSRARSLIIFVICRNLAFVPERGRCEAITRAGRTSVRIRGFNDKAATAAAMNVPETTVANEREITRQIYLPNGNDAHGREGSRLSRDATNFRSDV